MNMTDSFLDGFYLYYIFLIYTYFKYMNNPKELYINPSIKFTQQRAGYHLVNIEATT